MSKKIYLAGAVTGHEPSAVEQKFAQKQDELMSEGHYVVNPVKLIRDVNKSWKEAMQICVPVLIVCDAIYLLHDWQTSKGARLERLIAMELGMEIIYG